MKYRNWFVFSPIIRTDIREKEPAIPMVLELQMMDVDKCQPVPDAYIDIWQANATGFYGGFAAQGTEGATWLRGVSPTNSNGVVRFVSIFPGHYPTRAVHTHIMARVGGKVKNGYYQGGQTPLIGQLYYNQDLIDQISRRQPYIQNRNKLVKNWEDRVFLEQNKDYDGEFSN
jgi:protocatechuate 3,4-dioxygenase beta subunit